MVPPRWQPLLDWQRAIEHFSSLYQGDESVRTTSVRLVMWKDVKAQVSPGELARGWHSEGIERRTQRQLRSCAKLGLGPAPSLRLSEDD